MKSRAENTNPGIPDVRLVQSAAVVPPELVPAELVTVSVQMAGFAAKHSSPREKIWGQAGMPLR